MDSSEHLATNREKLTGDINSGATTLATSPNLPSLEECRELLRAEPPRQGDVFQWIDPAPGEDVWRRFGVIVTADCDVAHRKHRGVLSYCPILNLEDYLSLFWFPDQLARREIHLIKIVAHEIASLQKKYSGFEETVSADVIPSWLERSGSQGVANDLRVPSGPERVALEQKLELYTVVAAARRSQDVREQARALVCAKTESTLRDVKTQKETELRVWEEFYGHTRKLPGDWFLLNRLPGGFAGGFLVYLRRIGEIEETKIAIIPDQEKRGRGSVVARRLGRMNPPFLYRLTQQLAAVFADIGLPDEYEEMCSSTVRSFTDGQRGATEDQ